MKKMLMMSMMVFMTVMVEAKPVITDEMLHAIAMQESRNTTGVIGDLHMKEHSYGKYQIRRVYLNDVLAVHGKEFKKKFGVKPTLETVRNNDEIGKLVVTRYLEMYGHKYEEATGKALSPKVAFMIHNGGPQGWNPKFKGLYNKASSYAASAMKWYKKA